MAAAQYVRVVRPLPSTALDRLTTPHEPAPATRALAVFRHVPCEGPHRILDAFEATPVVLIDVLDDPGTPLPAPGGLCGAISMGGPMSANDLEEHPRLATEIAWLAQAHATGLPILGVCLGSQLLARALGASVAPAGHYELGFSTIEVLDEADPLMAALGAASVLHWHGEAFELPHGAKPMARSQLTPLQGFRAGATSWGLLFHPEADAALIDLWLRQEPMLTDAREHLGPGCEHLLREGAAAIDPAAGARMFAAFAAVCRGG